MWSWWWWMWRRGGRWRWGGRCRRGGRSDDVKANLVPNLRWKGEEHFFTPWQTLTDSLGWSVLSTATSSECVSEWVSGRVWHMYNSSFPRTRHGHSSTHNKLRRTGKKTTLLHRSWTELPRTLFNSFYLNFFYTQGQRQGHWPWSWSRGLRGFGKWTQFSA